MTGIYGIPESFQEAAPTPEPEPVRVRHGRPPKSLVDQRDAQVLELVQGSEGISRVAVAEKLGLTLHEAYLALSRVKHTGAIRTVRRDNAHVWIAVPPHTSER